MNLRLIAKVIAGQAHIGNLVTDEFLYYADVLGLLKREEAILIATLQRHSHSAPATLADEGGRAGEAQDAAIGELVPCLYSSEKHFKAVASATTRTGLIIAQSAIGAMVYEITPLLEHLMSLVPFEDALREEGSGTG